MEDYSEMDWQATPPAAEINAIYNPVMFERRRPYDKFEIPNLPGGWIDYYTERQFDVEDVVQFQHLARPSIITCAKQAVGQAKRRCVEVAASVGQISTVAAYAIVRRVRGTQADQRRRPVSPRHSPRRSPCHSHIYAGGRPQPTTFAAPGRIITPVQGTTHAPTVPHTPTPRSHTIASAHETSASRSDALFSEPSAPGSALQRLAAGMHTPNSEEHTPAPGPQTPANRGAWFDDSWNAPSPSHFANIESNVSFVDLNKTQTPETPKTPSSYSVLAELQLQTELEQAASAADDKSNKPIVPANPVTPKPKPYPSYLEGHDSDFSSHVPAFTPELAPSEADITPTRPRRSLASRRISACSTEWSPTDVSSSPILKPRLPASPASPVLDYSSIAAEVMASKNVTFTYTGKPRLPGTPYPNLEFNSLLSEASITPTKPQLPVTPQQKPYPSYLDAADSDFSSRVDFSPDATNVATPVPDSPVDVTEFSSFVPFSPDVEDGTDIPGTADAAAAEAEDELHVPHTVDVTEFSSFVPFSPDVEDGTDIPGTADAAAAKAEDELHVPHTVDVTEFSSFVPFSPDVEDDTDIPGTADAAAAEAEDELHVPHTVDVTEFSSFVPFSPDVEDDTGIPGTADAAAAEAEDELHVPHTVEITESSSNVPFSLDVEDVTDIPNTTDAAVIEGEDETHTSNIIDDAAVQIEDEPAVSNDADVIAVEADATPHVSVRADAIIPTTEITSVSNVYEHATVVKNDPEASHSVDATIPTIEVTPHISDVVDNADVNVNVDAISPVSHSADAIIPTIEATPHASNIVENAGDVALEVDVPSHVSHSADAIVPTIEVEPHASNVIDNVDPAVEDESHLSTTANDPDGFSSYVTKFSLHLSDYPAQPATPDWYEEPAVSPYRKSAEIVTRRLTRAARQREEEERKRKEKQRQRNLEKAKISALTQEWEGKVRNAVRNGMPPDYKAADFARVVPAQQGGFTDSWLNDESVNGYLKLITKFHNTHHTSSIPKSHAFPSFMLTQIAKKGYKGVERWAKRAKIGGKDLLQTHTIFIPVNNGSHWTLMVVYPGARVAHYYDSMGRNRTDNGKKWFDLVKIWLRGELGNDYNEREWSFFDKESPQQNNSSDCGVFAITTAKMLILGADVLGYGPGDIPLQRKRIVAELVNGDFL